MKTAAILGLGKSGKSACRYLQSKGFRVLVCDDNVQKSDLQLPILSAAALMEQIEGCSFLITSPGISLTHPVLQRAKECGVEFFCDVEYAFRERSSGYYGITGTNGKTTTTLLVQHLMRAADIEAKAVGNVGVPILDETTQAELLIVELSSFQLQTISTPVLQAACLLNISANHLDHHASMEEYVQAKQHIGRLLQEKGILFVGEKAYAEFDWQHLPCKVERFGYSQQCEIFSDGVFIWRYGVKEGLVPSKLKGVRAHDLENFLAAYCICRHQGVAAEMCIEHYDSFIKPSHRIQLVREHQGVKFYDDSKATNIDAVIRAVETLEKNILLIAGGVHKGHPYHAWRNAFSSRVKELFLVGPAAGVIAADLEGCMPMTHCKSFEEAVQRAAARAVSGDHVLLSPGCSSYDQFANFEERGRTFQNLVQAII